MKIRIFTNIPSPYRFDYYNELGKFVDLEVIMEAEKNSELNSKWYPKQSDSNFNSVYLKTGEIEEKRINFKILKYVKKDTDFLVFTNYAYFTEMLGLLYAKIKRIDYVLQIDGGLFKKKENIIKKRIKKILISGASAYFSPSENTDNYLMSYGAPKNKIHRYPFTSLKKGEILNSPISEKEKINIKKELNIQEQKFVLSIGQFIPRKGFEWMIEAYNDLDQSIGIYIIGGNPPENYLALKSKFKMMNLHFVSFQDKKNILKWFQACDLFVLPTLDDIWGLVVNEALSQGAPVISTNSCGSALELIKNGYNGYTVDIYNYLDLIMKTEEIVNASDEIHAKFQKNALNIIKEYSIENMVEMQMNYFKSVKQTRSNCKIKIQ